MDINQKNFIRFAAICCFLSVITTLGIHLFFPDAPTGFEERARLHNNTMYLLNRWWIIIHCLLALIAMWGVFLVQYKKSPGFSGLGFLFFGVFAITEIARQLLVLFYLNPLRVKYLAETNEAVKTILKLEIENFSLLGTSMFGLFVLAFGLGNLCYGLSLFKEKGFSKVLSWLLILWSFGSFTALGNEFWNSNGINIFIGHYNAFYQPIMRGLLAWWLLKSIKNK